MEIDTKPLLKAVEEMKKEHNKQYVEDCLKGMLKLKQIDIHQFCEAMELIYE